MADILATNPKLDDVIRRAANRLGENHGLTRDNHGMRIDNEGNSSRYVGSNGRHPSKSSQPQTSKRQGWHRTLNEEEDLNEGFLASMLIYLLLDQLEDWIWGDDDEGGDKVTNPNSWNDFKNKNRDTFEKLGADAPKSFDDLKRMGRELDKDNKGKELREKSPRSRYWKWPWERKKKRNEEDEMEEATGAASAGGYVGPIFGNITESIIREEISKKVLKKERLNEGWFKDWFFTHFPGGLFGCSGPWWDNCDDDGMVVQGGGDPNDPNAFNEFMSSVEWPSDFGPKPKNMQQLKKLAGSDKNNLRESLKNRLVKNLLNEKSFYNTGKFKYEKPNTSVSGSKNTPGIKETESTLKKSKKENEDYLKSFNKKIKEYLDFEGNSNPEFPHQNNSKTDYKSPMYRNSSEDEEFIDDFRGMGLQDANGVEHLDRIDDYLNGSTKTGNSQDAANVVPSKLGKKLKKTMKRKKEKIAKRKSKMTNLRGMTPDVQTVTKESTPNVYIVEQKKEINKIKHLFNYSDTTQ
jgi:hypothetical protein